MICTIMHLSHNASGMEANIQVLSIRSSSSHSSLVVNSLRAPVLSGNIMFVRDFGYQGSFAHAQLMLK